MKRRKDEDSGSGTRVIDLRNALPTNIMWPSGPLQLTLCAGDGVQKYKDKMVTDIEWFSTRLEGHSRETKSTNVFCCSPDYNVPGLLENIQYLNTYPELKVLLVLCDTTNAEHLRKFAEIFGNKLTIINEDMACSGQALSPEILIRVLVPGGKYIIDDMTKIREYKEQTNDLIIEMQEYNKMVITKPISSLHSGNKVSIQSGNKGSLRGGRRSLQSGTLRGRERSSLKGTTSSLRRANSRRKKERLNKIELKIK